MRGKVGAAAAFLSKISPRKTVLYVCSYLQGRGGLGLGIVVRSMYSLTLDPPLKMKNPWTCRWFLMKIIGHSYEEASIFLTISGSSKVFSYLKKEIEISIDLSDQ